MFEAGKDYKIIYKIIYKIDDSSVKYDIIDAQTSESVLINPKILKAISGNFMLQYIKSVLDPTLEESNKTVIQENSDYILISTPDMRYELKNKKTNETVKGFRGFVTDMSFKKGTVYLCEANGIETKEEFLKTDYQKTAKIVLEVIECDSQTVTYSYVKPENLAGSKIKFNIRVKD